ncbi:MAG TPA: hypothetical protein VKA70_05550 [Blastocatellia bacterium]|nr:hypothetical protein [Blastocatellia bacterium]
MSADEFEKRFQRHVEFMLEQQARFDARQAQFEQRQVLFEERLSRLEQVQEQQAENINRVVETVNSAVAEMREGYNRLIAIDELTNSLIEQLTQLGVRNSRRLTAVEHRVDKLEEKTP